MELENQDKQVSLTGDPQAGLKWKKNMCFKCKYNEGRRCTYYDKDRLEVPVDIFDCPSFRSKNQEVEELFGL